MLQFVKKSKVFNESGNAPYQCTNEEPETFNKLLDQYLPGTFKKVGAIASGGEVSFFCLMPRAQEYVVIDHYIGSLRVFCTKLTLLQHLGPEKCKKLLCPTSSWGPKYDEDCKTLSEAVFGVQERLPKELQTEASKTPYMMSPATTSAEWKRAEEDKLRAAALIGDRTTVVAGDLYDLKDHGPFDLLYISNAHEHTGINGLPRFERIAELVTPNGHLLLATNHGFQSSQAVPFTSVAKINGLRTSWRHELLVKAEQVSA